VWSWWSSEGRRTTTEILAPRDTMTTKWGARHTADILARMRWLGLMASVGVLCCCAAGAGQQGAKAPAKANDAPCGMIYGKDHSLLLCAPRGWVLDNQALAQQGIYATFYRQSFSYQEAEAGATLMYVNVKGKVGVAQTAAAMMKLDAQKTKSESPHGVIERAAPIVIPAGKGQKSRSVPVQRFLNDFGGGYEAVAYVEDERTITLIVISSVSKAILGQDYPSFVKLVQSYVAMQQ